MQGNICSRWFYTPFTLCKQLQPWSAADCEGWGWNSPFWHSPSKQTSAKAACVRARVCLCVFKQFSWIRLDVCSGLIWGKPNTLGAIGGNGWLIGTLSFFGQTQTHLLCSSTSSCTNQNHGSGEKNKHHGVRLRNKVGIQDVIAKFGAEVNKNSKLDQCQPTKCWSAQLMQSKIIYFFLFKYLFIDLRDKPVGLSKKKTQTDDRIDGWGRDLLRGGEGILCWC